MQLDLPFPQIAESMGGITTFKDRVPVTFADEDILQVLRGINDPELGINIVDLGLVYRVTRTTDRLDVAITLTSPSCPLGEMMVEEARYALEQRFPGGPPVHVELVWQPPWTRDRISEAARQILG